MAKKAAALTGYRKVSNVGSGYLALLFSGLGMVQIFLAGVGVFGRDFDMHRVLGHILSTLALIIIVLAVVARQSRKAIALAAVLVVLAVFANNALANLGWDNKWIGGLHALSGIISVIFAGRLGRLVLGKTS